MDDPKENLGKKNFDKKKRLEKTLKKNLHARNVLILTKSGRKSFQFFLCATQNKALEIMKLV